MSAPLLDLFAGDAPASAPIMANAAPRSVSFVMPGDPRGKGRPRAAVINGRARMFTPRETAREESNVRFFAAEAMAGDPPLVGALALHISAYLAIPASWSGKRRANAAAGILRPTTRPDWDNVAKLICDAIQGVAYRDDTQIVRATVEKHYDAQPRVEVTVAEIEGTRL